MVAFQTYRSTLLASPNVPTGSGLRRLFEHEALIQVCADSCPRARKVQVAEASSAFTASVMRRQLAGVHHSESASVSFWPWRSEKKYRFLEPAKP